MSAAKHSVPASCQDAGQPTAGARCALNSRCVNVCTVPPRWGYTETQWPRDALLRSPTMGIDVDLLLESTPSRTGKLPTLSWWTVALATLQ